jgi:hypothetical protein
VTTGSGGVRAGKWGDRLPGAKYWHAELEALEAEMAGGSPILERDETSGAFATWRTSQGNIRRKSRQNLPRGIQPGISPNFWIMASTIGRVTERKCGSH